MQRLTATYPHLSRQSAAMNGRPERYPEAVREYVISEVCDHGRKCQPTVAKLNRGEVDGFGKVPVSYSTARGWVETERQLRNRAIPLEDQSLDAFVNRLWAVAGGELRKLERDARSKKPLDVKRLNELEAFAARCRRHLTRDPAKDPGQPPVASDCEGPESLLEKLAREQAEQRSSAAASDPPTLHTNGDTDHGPIQAEDPEADKDKDPASPALTFVGADPARQPVVAQH